MAVVEIAGNDRLVRAREVLRAVERRSSAGESQPADRFLPVIPALAPLLPGGGLRRGTVVSLAPPREPAAGRRPEPRRPPGRPTGPAHHRRTRVRWGTGSTSLVWMLISAASAGGAWIGVVGRPDLGLVAAAEAGVRLDRLALVPDPGGDLLGVTSALLDGLDVVVAGGSSAPAPAARERLAARARQRGSVLLTPDPWPGADLELACTGSRWSGIGEGGSGRLGERQVEVRVRGRGLHPAGRETRIVLPGDLRAGTPEVRPGTGPAEEPSDSGAAAMSTGATGASSPLDGACRAVAGIGAGAGGSRARVAG